MRFNKTYLHCGPRLLSSLENELHDVFEIISAVKWSEMFSIDINGTTYSNQTGYNKAIENGFKLKNWEIQPLLRDNPKLIGDFRKNLVFGEVQFGNSATLYRDFYKFQYGLQNGLLSMAVLIVPNNEYRFFPTRPESVRNMANYELSRKFFTTTNICSYPDNRFISRF